MPHLRLLMIVTLAAAMLAGCAGNKPAADGMMVITPAAPADTRRFEYRVIRLDDVAPRSPATMERLGASRAAARKELEPQGWEYVGTEISVTPGKPSMLLFRRPLEEAAR